MGFRLIHLLYWRMPSRPPQQLIERFTIQTLAAHLEGATNASPAIILYGALAPEGGDLE